MANCDHQNYNHTILKMTRPTWGGEGKSGEKEKVQHVGYYPSWGMVMVMIYRVIYVLYRPSILLNIEH